MKPRSPSCYSGERPIAMRVCANWTKHTECGCAPASAPISQGCGRKTWPSATRTSSSNSCKSWIRLTLRPDRHRSIRTNRSSRFCSPSLVDAASIGFEEAGAMTSLSSTSGPRSEGPRPACAGRRSMPWCEARSETRFGWLSQNCQRRSVSSGASSSKRLRRPVIDRVSKNCANWFGRRTDQTTLSSRSSER